MKTDHDYDYEHEHDQEPYYPSISSISTQRLL